MPGTKARKRPNTRHRRPRRAQNAAAVSHVDNVRAVRKFMIFSSVEFANANSEYAFGLKAFNINGNGTPLKDLLDDYGRVYEQYRVRRVIVRASPGKGMDNDFRIKTFVAARVDVDHQDSNATVSNLKGLINAENSVVKTFASGTNIKLCDYKPQLRVNTTASLPILPNRLQFYPIGDHETHIWKGTVIAAFNPETNIQLQSKFVTLTAEVDVEFRGRVTAPSLFTLEHLNQDAPPVEPDQSGTLLELKNGYLTGTKFPIGDYSNVNVANIGHSVTAEQMLDKQYRDQSSMKIYYISSFDILNDSWGAMEVQT